MNRRKVIYVQHAPSLGGSVISLREVIVDASRKGYECIVICPNKTIEEYYQPLCRTYVSVIAPLNHNTAYHYKLSPLEFLRVCKVLLKTLFSFIAIFRIIRRERPHLVHLNSSTLILYPVLCSILGIPSVLHIRETVVNGAIGFRKKVLLQIANIFSSHIIFISEFEYENFQTRNTKSVVIYNYVHLNDFLAGAQSSEDERNGNTFVTLGGLFSLKGGDVLLEALEAMPEYVKLLVLGSSPSVAGSRELEDVEGPAYTEKIESLLKRSRARVIGRVLHAAPYIAMGDVLIFWAAAPHFPRPVFEAWLLRKPVIYYNPGYRNNVIDSGNIIRVENNSKEALNDAMKKFLLLRDPLSLNTDRSFDIAVNNFTEKNFEKIDALYLQCLKE